MSKKKTEFRIEIHPDCQAEIDQMSEEDRAEIIKHLESLARNPYQGESCAPGLRGFLMNIHMRWMWVKREIWLFKEKIKGKFS